MDDPRDELSQLRIANPVPTERIISLAESGELDRLYDRILARALRRRWRAPRRLMFSFAVLTMSTATAASAYLLATREPTSTLTVGCYAAADLTAKTVIVPADGLEPEQACADLWRRGVFGSAGASPPLAACVLASGVVGVFPAGTADTPCGPVDLPQAPSGPPAPAARDFVAFKDAVVNEFLATKCVGLEQGRAIVRRELDARAMNDWTIQLGAGVEGERVATERPCVGLAFQQDQREVLLVPMPPSP